MKMLLLVWGMSLVACSAESDEETARRNWQRVQQDREAAEKDRREADLKVKKAVENLQAREDAKPAMKLPAGPKPMDVIGRTRAKVRHSLSNDTVINGEHVTSTIDGTVIMVKFSKKWIATEYVIHPASYSAVRDKAALLNWLGVGHNATINKRTMKIVSRPDGALVYDATEEAERAPSIQKTRCFKTAIDLLAKAKRCAIDTRDRSAEKICDELFAEDFTDEMTVKRLAVYTRDGCESLRVAFAGERI